jgi:hypothetical protein
MTGRHRFDDTSRTRPNTPVSPTIYKRAKDPRSSKRVLQRNPSMIFSPSTITEPDFRPDISALIEMNSLRPTYQ